MLFFDTRLQAIQASLERIVILEDEIEQERESIENFYDQARAAEDPELPEILALMNDYGYDP